MPPQTCTAKGILNSPVVGQPRISAIPYRDPNFLRQSGFHEWAARTIDNAYPLKMVDETAQEVSQSQMVDALIIGGGIPGISIAMSLARTLHTAVVFDSDAYDTPVAHRPATAASQESSQQFLDNARSLIQARYQSARFSDAKIVRISRTDANENESTAFLAVDSEGHEWRGRKMVLAMGIKFEFPDLEGFEACWNKRIFDNLVRHTGQSEYSSVGILAIDRDANVDRAYELVTQAQNVTERVTVYTNGNLSLAAEIAERFQSQSIEINSRRIAKLNLVQDGVSIFWYDGSSATENVLIQKPRLKLNTPFAEQLGVAMTDDGTILTHFPFNETSEPGVFAAGDCASPTRIGTQAVVMGAFVAGGIQMQTSEDSSIDSTFNTLQV